jgi:hypothetical protein
MTSNYHMGSSAGWEINKLSTRRKRSGTFETQLTGFVEIVFVSKSEFYRFSDTRAIGWEQLAILSSFNILRRASLTKSKRE